MPIRSDLKSFYGDEWVNVIRPRILKRAYKACEKCGKPDRKLLDVVTQPGIQYWKRAGGKFWRNSFGDWTFHKPPTWGREGQITCVLSIAHLDHNPANMDDKNLMAMCQYCHLTHDKLDHARSRMRRKDGQRPLFVAVGEAGIPLDQSQPIGQPGKLTLVARGGQRV